MPCEEQAVNRIESFPTFSLNNDDIRADKQTVYYLQIAYKLGGDRAPHCLATVERVFLGDRTIQTAGGLTRIQFEV